MLSFNILLEFVRDAHTNNISAILGSLKKNYTSFTKSIYHDKKKVIKDWKLQMIRIV